MSGLAGFWQGLPARNEVALKAQLAVLLFGLAHRGRHRAAWWDASHGLAMGRCVSEPLGEPDRHIARCDRFVVAFAGRLHDRPTLLRELRHAGAAPDAEAGDEHLMLQGIARWGLQRMLTRCEGAFALAVWDLQAMRLTLAVDRFGQRPLYYGRCGRTLVFASETKALRLHEGFDDRLDTGAIAHLLRLDYIPAPRSIHAGIAKLAPGHWVHFDLRTGDASDARPQASAYWQAESLMAEALAARDPQAPMEDVLDALETTISAALRRQGPRRRPTLLLSGGVDSSLIAALMQAQQDTPLDAVTIAFEQERHDESHWAMAVARHLRVRHHVLAMDGRLAADLVARLPEVWCEPFADPSQLPTLLATRMAAGWTRDLCSGDGADELFFGHGAYARALRNQHLASAVPTSWREWMARRPRHMPEAARLGGWPAFRDALGAHTLAASWMQRISRWRDPSRALCGSPEPVLPQMLAAEASIVAMDDADRLQLLDLSLDLPFGVLTKLERAAAARGLQVDCPFLDLQVARLGWSLPRAFKQRDGQQKYVLKQLLARHLPAELVWRPKRGFGPPIANWLAGPLRDWAAALLDPVRLRDQGVFDAGQIDYLWQDFLGGRRKWHTHLWSVLMFQAWHAHWRETRLQRPREPDSLN